MRKQPPVLCSPVRSSNCSATGARRCQKQRMAIIVSGGCQRTRCSAEEIAREIFWARGIKQSRRRSCLSPPPPDRENSRRHPPARFLLHHPADDFTKPFTNFPYIVIMRL